MKNITIQLPLAGEKLEALRLALEAKDIFLEDEVEQFLLGLYRRTVHKEVRAYLDNKPQKQPRARKKEDGLRNLENH